MEPSETDEVYSFEQVLGEELREIAGSRRLRSQNAKGSDEKEGRTVPLPPEPKGKPKGYKTGKDAVYRQAYDMELMGLSFSGGGIRSATFNLGVLQALAELKLLRLFDYLSTVSGGGYIGGWLGAWAKREGSITEAEKRLSPQAGGADETPEPHTVKFLRKFSNYLTPKLGFFSADTWMLVSTYLRNLFLNLAVLLSFLVGVLLLPEAILWVFREFFSVTRAPLLLFYAAMLLFLSGVTVININLENLVTRPKLSPGLSGYLSHRNIILKAVVPLAGFSVLGSFCLWRYRPYVLDKKTLLFVLLYLVYLLGWFLAIYWIKLQGKPVHNVQNFRSAMSETFARVKQKRGKRQVFWQAAGMALAVVLGSLVVGRLLNTLPEFEKANQLHYWYVLTWGMPVMTLVLMGAATLQIGLIGRDMPDQSHEWWSRLGGLFFIVTFAWVGIFGVVLYGLNVLNYLNDKILLSSGSVFTAAGLLAGRSPATNGRDSKPWLEILAKAAPYVFVAGILILMSYVTQVYISNAENKVQEKILKFMVELTGVDKLKDSHLLKLACLITGYFFLALILSWRVDINKFSMHPMYRNRLTRCYLGASNGNRNPHIFTGFDPRDDMHLSELSPSSPGGQGSGYDGPYPIINATLNLVSGKELAWQERKAASFVFTPRYSGYQLAERGYFQPTKDYAKDDMRVIDLGLKAPAKSEGILLGNAMAISGAATSPNMGYHSSPPLAFLMTVFNVRLGWWCGNPRYPDAWKRSGPDIGLKYLLAELFGRTDDEQRYVYISDGGHFENLGVYELVRRRCRYIIACDAAQDRDLKFGDLGNAIRKCYTDLGVKIDIDVDDIERQGNDGYSKSYYAVGTIHYENIDPGMKPGILLYIKSTLTGKEPADIEEYAAHHDKFPHQSTANQWFDESQFESYRKLGHHIAVKTFELIGGKEKQALTRKEFIRALEKKAKQAVG